MKLNEPLLAELNHEAASTRRCLERIPHESLAWKPHTRSRGLGEIAAHVANVPAIFIASMNRDGFDRTQYTPMATDTVPHILEAFDANVIGASETLKKVSDEELLAPWRYTYGDKVIFEMTRLAVIRTMGLNHLIHHRGQLTVYLRLLDIPVPGVYGPSADEV